MKRHFSARAFHWAVALGFAGALGLAIPSEAGQRAVPRGGSDDGGGGGRAVPRGDSGGGSSAPAPSPGGGGSGRAVPSGDGGGSQAVPARPRGDREPSGVAVPRRAAPPPSGGGTIIIPGYGNYYPWGWGYGGLGLGGYYGFYDPWWYGYSPGYYSSDYEGSIRLKVKPRDAAVFVDGYFAGEVDEFDGLFQRLHVEPGPHRIEVRADGFETLSFDVRILPDRTVTYEGELREIP